MKFGGDSIVFPKAGSNISRKDLRNTHWPSKESGYLDFLDFEFLWIISASYLNIQTYYPGNFTSKF